MIPGFTNAGVDDIGSVAVHTFDLECGLAPAASSLPSLPDSIKGTVRSGFGGLGGCSEGGEAEGGCCEWEDEDFFEFVHEGVYSPLLVVGGCDYPM